MDTPSDDNMRGTMSTVEESAPSAVEDAGKNQAISEAEIETPPKPAAAKKKSTPKIDTNTVTVSIAALLYRAGRRNSLSVAVLQDRLADCNYGGVRADFRGWYHTHTRKAVEDWQRDNGLEVTGACTADDMAYLFDGTDIVIVA